MPDLETTTQRISREAREEHDAAHRSAISFLRRQPLAAPGKSPSEKERVEAQRQAREAAAALQAEERRHAALAQQQAALDEKSRIVAFQALVGNELGQARHRLGLAVGVEDFEGAFEAAGRVAALELLEIAVKRRRAEFDKTHHGSSYYVINAERV